jgi:two-component system cell cycle response regulator
MATTLPRSGRAGVIVLEQVDLSQQLRCERERVATLEARLLELEAAASQLEAYASDLNQTYDQLRRHLEHMTVLQQASARIASLLDPDKVLATMLDSLEQLIGYETAAVYLADQAMAMPSRVSGTIIPSDGLLRVRAERTTRGAANAVQGDVAAEGSAIAEAIRAQQTVVGCATAGDTEMMVPLRTAERALGVLYLCRDRPAADEEVQVVELLAAAVAVALQNAHLYQETQRLATTDPLTGLINHRHFHKLLNLEVERARRMGYPLGFIMIDLDHFKQVNDRYLHPTGDAVLCRVGSELQSRLRRTDVIGRLGGEEFGVILPGASLEEVAVVAEKVRRAVEDLSPLRGDADSTPLQLTASVGGVSLPPHAVESDLLEHFADKALYDAKRGGRNQVRLWTEGTGSHFPRS